MNLSGNRNRVKGLKLELLEIEKELAGPEKDAALKKYDRALVALGERVVAALKAGVAPGEYAKCEELAAAVTVARKLLRLQVRD